MQLRPATLSSVQASDKYMPAMPDVLWGCYMHHNLLDLGAHGDVCCMWGCPQVAYEAFMKQNPELEAFEAELKKYMAIETEVSNISPVYNIGEEAHLA